MYIATQEFDVSKQNLSKLGHAIFQSRQQMRTQTDNNPVLEAQNQK